MKQETTLQKRNKGKPLTGSSVVMLLKDILRPVLSLIASTRVPYQVIITEPARIIPGRPVIYAVNHFCFADTPIMGRLLQNVPISCWANSD